MTDFSRMPAMNDAREVTRDASSKAPAMKLSARGVDFHYDRSHAVHSVSLDVPEHRVTALSGPSGCGKSTLLRVFNRIYSLYPQQRATGEILLDGRNVISNDIDVNELRSRVGMVFQKP